MIFAKRVALVVGLATFLLTILILHSRSATTTWQDVSQAVGLGEPVEEDSVDDSNNSRISQNPETGRPTATPSVSPINSVKSPTSPYSRALVLGHLSSENMTWLEELDVANLEKHIYVVDDQSAPLHTPTNKGHEAMVYLTYIIDHYDQLADITIFMHGHKRAWHNNELLNHDATEMIRRLSSERVTREGYMNLRCHWDPGCPEYIYPRVAQVYIDKPEEKAIANAWAELFPDHPIPKVISAPCCAQFAVSKSQIHSIPKSTFEKYRDWLLNTQLTDWVSGRVFEYLWQMIFTYEPSLCPDMRACHCDGYGICFEDDEEFNHWYELRYQVRQLEKELEVWTTEAENLEETSRNNIEQEEVAIPKLQGDVILNRQIKTIWDDLEVRRNRALAVGVDPRIRAASAGRKWSEGDGY